MYIRRRYVCMHIVGWIVFEFWLSTLLLPVCNKGSWLVGWIENWCTWNAKRLHNGVSQWFDMANCQCDIHVACHLGQRKNGSMTTARREERLAAMHNMLCYSAQWTIRGRGSARDCLILKQTQSFFISFIPIGPSSQWKVSSSLLREHMQVNPLRLDCW